MRNDNKKTVTVGIFVLIGIIILVVGVLTLGAQQKAFVKSFRVYAVFDDIGGLQTGNNVWFSGVKIGTVKKINFYGNSQVEIEMNIESNTQDFIRKNSKATISSDGLIGNKIIVIYGGSSDSPSIEAGDRLEAVMPLDTDKMMETLQENNQNLVSITNDLKVLTGKIAAGEGIVGALLTDSTLAIGFRDLLSDMDRTAQNSRLLTSELVGFSLKLNSKGTPIDDLLNDSTLVPSLKASAAQLQQTMQEANQAAESLREATGKLTTSDNAAGMLLNDEEFASYLKGTMRHLDDGTESFNETLESLRYHWFFRGAFRRADKARGAAEQE